MMQKHRLNITWLSSTKVIPIDPQQEIGTRTHFDYVKEIEEGVLTLVQDLIDDAVVRVQVEIKEEEC